MYTDTTWDPVSPKGFNGLTPHLPSPPPLDFQHSVCSWKMLCPLLVNIPSYFSAFLYFPKYIPSTYGVGGGFAYFVSYLLDMVT